MLVQIVPEEDADKFDFHILNATKLIPETLATVRNPQRDGFFHSQIDADAANDEPNSISGDADTSPAGLPP